MDKKFVTIKQKKWKFVKLLLVKIDVVTLVYSVTLWTIDIITCCCVGKKP